VRLDAITTGANADAGITVNGNDDVADLDRAVEGSTVDDDAAADAGPECQHDEVARASSRPVLELGKRGRAGIVRYRDRQVEARAEYAAQRKLDEGKVVDPKATPKLSMCPGTAKPTAVTSGDRAFSTSSMRAATSS
jgi:hypothetical protein